MAVDYYGFALATTPAMDHQAVEVYEAAGAMAGAAPILIQVCRRCSARCSARVC